MQLGRVLVAVCGGVEISMNVWTIRRDKKVAYVERL